MAGLWALGNGGHSGVCQDTQGTTRYRVPSDWDLWGLPGHQGGTWLIHGVSLDCVGPPHRCLGCPCQGPSRTSPGGGSTHHSYTWRGSSWVSSPRCERASPKQEQGQGRGPPPLPPGCGVSPLGCRDRDSGLSQGPDSTVPASSSAAGMRRARHRLFQPGAGEPTDVSNYCPIRSSLALPAPALGSEGTTAALFAFT